MIRRFLVLLVIWGAGGQAAQGQTSPATIREVYAERQTTQLVLDVEAALAVAQARHGVIPASAAQEICLRASADVVSAADLAAENRIVRHRMVSLLNVWRRSLSREAGDFLHYGATTVDIYDTVEILQMRASILILIDKLRQAEDGLIALARAHRDTPMMGRTLGQHALPITFGKKISVWIDENRRNIERLRHLLARVERSAILKGAVGSYAGLGDAAIGVEQDFAGLLGLSPPYPGDWHGARDVMGEYGAVLGLIAQGWARFGQEMFLLQSTDIAEVREATAPGAVGSSTLPHKTNPVLSEALLHHGRVVPRLGAIVTDDVVNFFERDNTSRSNDAIGDLSAAAERMMDDVIALLARLEPDPEAMRANLDRTGGRIMSQRVVFALAPRLGRVAAEEEVRRAVEASGRAREGFRESLLAAPAIAAALSPDEVDALLDPTTGLGLAGEQVDRVIAAALAARAHDPSPVSLFVRPACEVQ